MKLLIQACSGRKKATSKPITAIELYDGVAFQVIKKFLRENQGRAPGLQILILSSEYGLISAAAEIPNYDRRMTGARAESLKTQNLTFWENFAGVQIFESMFINVGRDYLPALSLISFPAGVQFASGGIGFRNGQLKSWLHA